jgi:hypothetical protein
MSRDCNGSPGGEKLVAEPCEPPLPDTRSATVPALAGVAPAGPARSRTLSHQPRRGDGSTETEEHADDHIAHMVHP